MAVKDDSKKKDTFLLRKNWYEDVFADCSTEEKAWFLDAIYAYQLRGEVMKHPDRFINSHFKKMVREFDGNSEKYTRSCLMKSINKEMEHREKDGNTERVKELMQEKEYLIHHSLEGYSKRYSRVQLYTSVTDNDYETDNDNECDYEPEYEPVSDCVPDNVPERVPDSVMNDSYAPTETMNADAWKLKADDLPNYRDEIMYAGYCVGDAKVYLDLNEDKGFTNVSDLLRDMRQKNWKRY